MRNWLDRYGFASAIVVVILAVVVAKFFVPSRAERQAEELAACKKTCAPREGVMQGRKVLSNVPETDRRNYETFATCVCR
jgi:hypothetical protein